MPTKINVKGTIISNNRQWIYDWLEMDATSPNSVANSLPQDNSDIEVIINSGGGDVFAGSEIFTALKEYAGNVKVKIVGVAASAASVIAMAGDKILISPTAQMMIHNVSSYAEGDHNDMDHMSDILKSANNSIANSYRLKTGKTQEELLDLMNKETWFDAEKAKEHGFVDEVMFAENNAPSLMASSGAFVLNDNIIEKLFSIKDTISPSKKAKDEQQKAELQFRLLKLKGD